MFSLSVGQEFALPYSMMKGSLAEVAMWAVLEGQYFAFLDAWLEEHQAMFDFEIGKTYYIQTLTNHWMGTVVAVRGPVVSLSPASWIAITNRLADFTAGRVGRNITEIEVEPVRALPLQLNQAQISAVMPWPYEMLTEQR